MRTPLGSAGTAKNTIAGWTVTRIKKIIARQAQVTHHVSVKDT